MTSLYLFSDAKCDILLQFILTHLIVRAFEINREYMKQNCIIATIEICDSCSITHLSGEQIILLHIT